MLGCTMTKPRGTALGTRVIANLWFTLRQCTVSRTLHTLQQISAMYSAAVLKSVTENCSTSEAKRLEFPAMASRVYGTRHFRVGFANLFLHCVGGFCSGPPQVAAETGAHLCAIYKSEASSSL
jgi:hypothetical protein